MLGRGYSCEALSGRAISLCLTYISKVGSFEVPNSYPGVCSYSGLGFLLHNASEKAELLSSGLPVGRVNVAKQTY